MNWTKLGIKDLPEVGSVIELDARATVESVSAHAGKEYADQTVELQITHLEMEEDEGAKSMKTAQMLYTKMPKKEGK